MCVSVAVSVSVCVCVCLCVSVSVCVRARMHTRIQSTVQIIFYLSLLYKYVNTMYSNTIKYLQYSHSTMGLN